MHTKEHTRVYIKKMIMQTKKNTFMRTKYTQRVYGGNTVPTMTTQIIMQTKTTYMQTKKISFAYKKKQKKHTHTQKICQRKKKSCR